jgi:ATP-dependent DNA helicase DinG
VLTPEETTAIRGVYSALAGSSRKFSSRPQQRALIAFVAKALAQGQIGVSEAPTAVGKSFGYLVPAVTLACIRKQRLVISTGTVVLQNQLLEKDLPIVSEAVAQVLGKRMSFEILKGRGRFSCTLKLEHAGATGDLFASQDSNQVSPALLNAFKNGSWSGDIDTAPISITPVQWRQIANDRQSCIGHVCDAYGRCPYVKAMKSASEADVIVTNHDMFLRMTTGNDTGQVMPPLDEMMVIFDEAHQLPEKSMDALATKFDTSESWLDGAILLAQRLDSASGDTMQRQLKSLRRQLTVLERHLQAHALEGRIAHIHDELPPQIAATQPTIEKSAKSMLSHMRNVFASKSLKSRGDVSGRERVAATGYLNRLEEFVKAIDAFFGEKRETDARWAERTERGWRVCVSPFTSGSLLQARLWSKVKAAVLVSATLTINNGFGPMLSRLGLRDDKRASTLALDSPLDYSRSKIIIPKLSSNPDNVEKHTADIAQIIRSLDLTRGGVLVLFSSKKQMLGVKSLLSTDFSETILMQGTLTNSDLIKRHRARVINGFPSVLFGLQSFGEGLDLPGRLCVTVVIAKIPFPSVDDPILTAASDYLLKRNKQPFAILLVPAAAMTLKQNVGRLVRQEGDGGEVYIMDRRMMTKQYGRDLLKSLPMRHEFG